MRTLTTILILLFALPALAQDRNADSQQLGNGCWEFKLCDAEAGTGDCADSDGKALWASFLPGYSHTLYATDSDEASFTCTVRSAREYSTSLYGVTNPNITITHSYKVQPFDALLYTYWINCSVHGGSDTVTIYDYACPLTK